ncbi:MAG: N-6 DNA methylase [Methanoregula sp.]
MELNTNSQYRKRLGQFFTGTNLARLLAVIADGNNCHSAIDPMCGSGDMLIAVHSLSPDCLIAGIEIDTDVLAICTERFNNNHFFKPNLLQGNAFSWTTISQLPSFCYDLVITNPPYVRYQSFGNNGEISTSHLPDAKSIRKGLLEIVTKIDTLDAEDKKIFTSIIKGYSGLSDLAVPSWILSAMLTSLNGYIAMVVPESWLNRDYANPLHYLLLKLFRIQWVIEDANSRWFNEVQIKTNLLIAKRIPRVENIREAYRDQYYFHVSLPKSSITTNSIVGGIFPNSKDPDLQFAQVLHRLEKTGDAITKKSLIIKRYSLENKLDNIISISSNSKWFARLESLQHPARQISENMNQYIPKMPHEFFNLITNDVSEKFVTLGALGVNVGQGLRTGANSFFYCDLISKTSEGCYVKPNKIFRIPKLFLPCDILKPVLRKQSEISGSFQLQTLKLHGRLLIFENYIHPVDLDKMQNCSGGYKKQTIMPLELAKFVSTAAQKNIGTEQKPRYIPSLSAVKTNETKDLSQKKTTDSRFWYMLPALTKRHIPDLFIARVNTLHPRIMMNSDEETIIDANFSTLWCGIESSIDRFALLSVLNSNWIAACMELNGTVMGGGALKLEATQIRRLPIPKLNADKWEALSILGRKLLSDDNSENILNEINQLIIEDIFGNARKKSGMEKIDRIKKEKLMARKKTE